MGDEIRSEDFVAGILPEETTFRLGDDNPEAMEALKDSGYEGDAWFTIRALTAVENDEREVLAICFVDNDDDGSRQRYTVNMAAVRRFDIERMILDGRFPVHRNGRYVEQPWNKTASGPDRNYDHVCSMGRGLFDWLREKLGVMRGGEEDVDEAGNASPAAES